MVTHDAKNEIMPSAEQVYDKLGDYDSAWQAAADAHLRNQKHLMLTAWNIRQSESWNFSHEIA